MQLVENHVNPVRLRRNVRRVYLPPFATIPPGSARRGWNIAKEFADFPSMRPRRSEGPLVPGSTNDQLANLSTIFFQNDQNQSLHQMLEDAFTAKARGAPTLLLITGATQTGKTRALNEFLQDHPSAGEHSIVGTAETVPVLYLTAHPASCSVRALEHQIFMQLTGMPAFRSIRSKAIDGLIEILGEFAVELLIIDNAENFGRGSTRELSAIADLIGSLIEKTICGIVLAGEVGARRLAKRLRHTPTAEIQMGNFLCQEALPKFIQLLCENLPLPCSIDPHDAELLGLIRSIGPVGSVISLFKAAAIDALAQGAGKIGRDHLTAAAASRKGHLVTAPVSRKTHFPMRTVLHTSRLCLTRFVQPHPKESIGSFEKRFCKSNPYLAWSLQLAAAPGGFPLEPGQELPLSDLNPPRCASPRDHIQDLARLSGVSPHDLATMAAIYLGIGPDGRQWVSFMGQLIDSRAISLHQRWCPVCWNDSPYLRNIWRLAPLKICLEHQIWLEADPARDASQWRRPCLNQTVPQKAGLLDTINAHNVLMAFRQLPKAPTYPLRAEFAQGHSTVPAEIGECGSTSNDHPRYQPSK